MRDINRIDQVLSDLGAVWKTVPDLRLGQLLLNVIRDPALYYVEDDELVVYLQKFYQGESDE